MVDSWPEEFVLLALLSQKPEHGYGLHRRLQDDDLLARVWKIRRSQVYFLLSKLVQRRWVRRHRERASHGPPRTAYAITAAGRAALRRWMGTPVAAPRELRGPFAAKLYFALQTSPAAARSLVSRQKTVLRRWLVRRRRGLPPSGAAADVLRLRDIQTEAVLAYLDRLRPSHRGGGAVAKPTSHVRRAHGGKA